MLEPNLSGGLLSGDPAAIERLDAVVNSRVLDSSTLRVKLWDAMGLLVYPDKYRLFGERYELDDDKIESLRNNAVVSEVRNLDGPENRFETAATP
ncbi:MAG: hypothetical protein ACKVHU_14485 [Acidimicrobiales bacterium]